MFNLIEVTFSLFFIGLTGWMATTYIVKEDSQKFIEKELFKVIDICKMLFRSLINLIGVLAHYTFSSASVELTSTESKDLNKELLKLVKSVEEVEEDAAMSAFSPELIEVITEEEEKIA